MPKPSRRIVTLTEAAAYAALHPRTIRRRIADGTLTGIHPANTRALRVDLNEVDAMMRPIPTTRQTA